MKKTFGIIAASAFAIAAISAPVAAKPGIDPGAPYCFGQVHKAVNAGAVEGFDNVGQLVRFLGGGQEKNTLARSICSLNSNNG